MLKGVDLHIGRGEIVGLVGCHGSGTSTLVQGTNDLVRAMLGRELDVPPRARRERERLVSRVRGLAVTGRLQAVDLDLHAGEVLGAWGCAAREPRS